MSIEVQQQPGFPAIEGPHQLSWSYILDAVFADAYHNGIERLDVCLPTHGLVKAVELRAELTAGDPPVTGRRGLARLDGSVPESDAPDRLYCLTLGVVAPPRLRTKPPTLPGMVTLTTLSVFTLAARAWGIPLRVFLALRRPDMYDRASFAMRRDFARHGRVPAYYHLTTWCAS